MVSNWYVQPAQRASCSDLVRNTRMMLVRHSQQKSERVSAQELLY